METVVVADLQQALSVFIHFPIAEVTRAGGHEV